jgi:hypothetical protein
LQCEKSRKTGVFWEENTRKNKGEAPSAEAGAPGLGKPGALYIYA